MTPSIGRRLAIGTAIGAALARPAAAQAPNPAPAQAPAPLPPGLELYVAAKCPTTPTGIVLDRSNKLFVFMPRFDDKLKFSVGTVARDGTVTPFPDARTNQPDAAAPQATFFHTPNGVVDAAGRLWILDAGLMGESGPPTPGAAKLLCFDPASGKLLRTVPLSAGIEPTSSLNDLRVRAGGTGPELAFITDMGQDGQGALLAVDLANGRVRRRLARHFSTRSAEGITKIVETRALRKRPADGAAAPVQGGANGIALSPDGARLFYAPLMGRHLYSVDTAALLDETVPDAALAATVVDHGEKGLTGGLAADSQGRIYLSLQELNAVGRWTGRGEVEILAASPRLVWPDTFCITPDDWLYVSATQVNRRPGYNGGVDRQKPPYEIFRLKIDAGPA